MQASKIVLLLTNICAAKCLDFKPGAMKKNAESCNKFGQKPFFDTELVVGKPWRIYYTWHVNLENKCMDLNFRNASQRAITRIYNDMMEYLDQQPAWDGATLHLTMGKARREMLLFADQGPAGRFLAVPNVVRDGSLSPARGSVPLLKFQMKLFRGGKYLVFMDCNIGVASLAARFDTPPFRAEIHAVAEETGFGDGGVQACLQDKNPDENFLIT